MVEYLLRLDGIFGSLADPTRRDILSRLQTAELNIGEVAAPYDMSLAAISKHLTILEKARLIRKRRQGKERYVSLAPETMLQAADYLKQYERMWNEQLDRLDQFLKEDIS
jgi:DNA-binding transcriptional ArsR family regulator